MKWKPYTTKYLFNKNKSIYSQKDIQVCLYAAMWTTTYSCMHNNHNNKKIEKQKNASQ